MTWEGEAEASAEKSSSSSGIAIPAKPSPKVWLMTGLKVMYELAEEVAERMELVLPSYTNMSFS